MYRRRKVIVKEKPAIPNNLKDFGYVIKENGQVRSVTEDQPYVFNFLHKDAPYNEERYETFIELLGDVVEADLQKAPYHFEKVIVPIGADPAKDVHSYIYMTPNAMTTTDKLMVMIPGNNTRIGQWSKRIMCDSSIKAGSMMEISDMVLKKGYQVIILNPNANFWYGGRAQLVVERHTKTAVTVPGSATPEEHCQYVFHNLIRNAKAEKVAIIANAWGAHSFTLSFNTEFDYIEKHVKVVAMIDSAHTRELIQVGKQRNFMFNNCSNWSVSSGGKGELQPDVHLGCPSISSGEEISDYTLPTMLKDIMKFIYTRMGDIALDDGSDDGESDVNERKELTQEELLELSCVEI